MYLMYFAHVKFLGRIIYFVYMGGCPCFQEIHAEEYKDSGPCCLQLTKFNDSGKKRGHTHIYTYTSTYTHVQKGHLYIYLCIKHIHTFKEREQANLAKYEQSVNLSERHISVYYTRFEIKKKKNSWERRKNKSKPKLWQNETMYAKC